MHQTICRWLAFGLALLCCILPLLAVHAADETPASTAEPEVTEAAPPEVSFDEALILHVLTANGVREMDLHSYLCGVLLAEMPAGFSPEALKAQAVASRTFALQQAQRGKHPEADICTDAACCQGWAAPDAAPDVFLQAVAATDGLVVTYGDELIEATFFSCSGGQTEAAVAVWGSDVPYLQSVSSPGEESAPRFTETVRQSAEEFAAILRAAQPELDLESDPSRWFGSLTRTAGGSVATLEIGGILFSGTQLRTLLGLRSTDMEFSVEGNVICITTWGYGHRVGLSQYGAEAMAQTGADFEEILLHYYQNTKIKRLFLAEQP